jgi:hypothetical protein
MKRLIGTGLMALLFATMVTPSAKAIRPELLPERVHPTIHTDVMPEQSSSAMKEWPKVQASMPTETAKSSEEKPLSDNERPPFEYFENIYRQLYGN